MATDSEVKILGMEGTEQLVANFKTLLAGKQNSITGTAGQFVVIGVDGKPATKTIPRAEEATF